MGDKKKDQRLKAIIYNLGRRSGKNELTKFMIEVEQRAVLGDAYQWAFENGIVAISPESLVQKFKESEDIE